MKKLEEILDQTANLIFPRRCPFCDEVIGFSQGCTECEPDLRVLRREDSQIQRQGHEMSALDAAFAMYYYEGIVKEAIKRMKFSDRTDQTAPFADQMAESLFCTEKLNVTEFDMVVPVASSGKELRSRGYDVPRLLAQRLAQKINCPMRQALCKIKETKRQMSLSGKERRENLKGAFAVCDATDIKGKRVLIVDDVFTTGSTMNECAKALKKAGAKSCCGVVIAVTRQRIAERNSKKG